VDPRNGRNSDSAEAQELALVKAIQRGHTQAWSALLTRYQDRLFGVCYRMVGDRDMASDLTQDSMVKIIEGLSPMTAAPSSRPG
jgi:RNA polymerase sigma-70 factor (ECF subfamily)